jgi:hypothetical protein
MIKIPRNIQLPIPEELSPDTALAIVEVAGSTGVAAIKTRTRAGRGIDDNKMKTPSKTPNEQGTYSKAYSDKRADRRVDIRDLTWTGAMVQGVILDEKAAFNQVMSPWFGISPQDEQAILAVAEAELQKLLSQA